MFRLLPTLVLALACLASAGCNSSGSGNSAAQSGLATAMDSVSGSGSAASYFEYADLAELRRLGVVHPELVVRRSGEPIAPRWYRVVDLGSDLVGYTQVPELIGFNTLAADTAIKIGMAPHRASRADGAIQAKTVATKLTALGAMPRTFGGDAGLSFGPDYSTNYGSKLGAATVVTGPALVIVLSQMVVTDHVFATSQDGGDLLNVLRPGSQSLLDTPHFSDMADCLGDVVGAIVHTPEYVGYANDAELVGLGVRTPASPDASVQNVVCVLPTAGAANAVHRSLAERLAPRATDPDTNKQMSTYVSTTDVDESGDFVRATLTLKPTTSAGYVVAGITSRLEGYWVGSCPAVRAARGSC